MLHANTFVLCEEWKANIHLLTIDNFINIIFFDILIQYVEIMCYEEVKERKCGNDGCQHDASMFTQKHDASITWEL